MGAGNALLLGSSESVYSIDEILMETVIVTQTKTWNLLMQKKMINLTQVFLPPPIQTFLKSSITDQQTGQMDRILCLIIISG